MTNPERRIFKFTDAAMLWAWNEFGLLWTTATRTINIIAFSAMIFSAYQSKQLTMTLIWMCIGALCVWVIGGISAQRHNKFALSSRLCTWAISIRFLWLIWFVADIFSHHPVGAFGDAAMIVERYVYLTLMPTGPRKPSLKFATVFQGATS